MTDIYGALPSNLAMLLEPGHAEGIGGVNLPMLLRAMTIAKKGMETMLSKAISGAATACHRT